VTRLTAVAPDRAQQVWSGSSRFQRATGELVSLGAFDATDPAPMTAIGKTTKKCCAPLLDSPMPCDYNVIT
jgi:hypothetical protein